MSDKVGCCLLVLYEKVSDCSSNEGSLIAFTSRGGGGGGACGDVRAVVHFCLLPLFTVKICSGRIVIR